jgi:elongation factor P
MGVFPMISAGDFRNGLTFEYEGNVYQVIEFQHVKPGKGAAFVRTKLRDIINGTIVEKTFRPTDKMPRAHIERKDMEYSYNDGDLYYFMDQETFELIPIEKSLIGDSLKYIKENDAVRILIYKGSVFGIEPPNFVELKIIETEPGFKGDTAQGATKPATLETGATIHVPLFINEGDVIRIDTRTGEYMERA